MNGNPDYTLLDDPALLVARAQVRAELDEVTARYRQLTEERGKRAGYCEQGQQTYLHVGPSFHSMRSGQSERSDKSGV